MDGILLINKEKGFTSRDVVNEMVKKFNTKKIGHTGTLDPLATGLLILTVGKACKLSEMLSYDEKEYICEAKLGIETDTLDISGNVINKDEKKVLKEDLKKVLNSFKKTYMQEVPLYSAVKVNGKKLYEYARNNEEVTLPKKEVTIKEIELIEYEENTFKFRCVVSKGTYIRSLVKDIGLSLNTCATMTNLIRTKVGSFNLDNAKNVKDITYKDIILMLDILKNYKQIEVNQVLENKVKNGQILDNIYDENIIVFKKENDVVAIYERYKKDKSKIKPKYVFKGVNDERTNY